MKKRYQKILSCLLSYILLISLLAVSPAMEISTKAAPADNGKKACWISFLDIEVFLQDKTEKEFRV